MKIGIASDHRGVILKEKIKNYLNDRYQIIDYGTNSIESVDYPLYAYKIGESIRDNKIDLGILICGTGIGMSIACNKVKKVRCAKVDNIKEVKYTRQDNDANIIAINGNMPLFRAKDITDVFLKTPFSNLERHKKRIEMLDNYKS